MSCISILCFGHIANKSSDILSILKEVIIFSWERWLISFWQNKYEYPTTKIRFFSFVEFIYEGKKLAAYAEEMPITIYLHMKTLKKSWSWSIHICFNNTKWVTIFRKNNNLLEYWKDVVKFIDNKAEKENRNANHSQRSWWHWSSSLRSDYALPETNIGKRTTGPHWDGVALVKTVLCQKGGTLPLKYFYLERGCTVKLKGCSLELARLQSPYNYIST